MKALKKRGYLYIIFIISFLLGLSITKASADKSLELCFKNPEISEYSFFIKLASNK